MRALIIATLVFSSLGSSTALASNRDSRAAIRHACVAEVKEKHLKGEAGKDEYSKCIADPKSFGIDF